jgi:cytochrome c553
MTDEGRISPDARIRVYLDASRDPIADSAPPASVALDTAGLPDGAHVVRIEAHDKDGSVGVREVRFWVRNGPGITLTGLHEQAHVKGMLRFTANAFGANDPFEPHRAESRAPIPVWVWVMMLLVLGWAGWYVAERWNPPAEFANTPTYAPIATASRTPPGAAQIAQQGNGKGAGACASCHGVAGEGNPGLAAPRLAGLPAPYLTEQLDSLANGYRQSAMMAPVAAALTTRERHALGDYYAALPTAALTPVSARLESNDETLGRQLALRGRAGASNEIPACVSCHGDQGSGVGATFPPLAGQSAAYIANQLHAWKLGRRAAGTLALMPTIANKLSDREIAAVADYFASLPPAATVVSSRSTQ